MRFDPSIPVCGVRSTPVSIPPPVQAAASPDLALADPGERLDADRSRRDREDEADEAADEVANDGKPRSGGERQPSNLQPAPIPDEVRPTS